MRHRGISMYSSKYRKYGLDIFLIWSAFTLLKTETIRHRRLVCLLCTILLGRSSSTFNKFVYAASVLVSLETAACHSDSAPEVEAVQ